MNKLFITFFFIIAALNLIQAQDGYIKYRSTTNYPKDTVKILKGEIVPFFKSPTSDKINVVVGNDTIKELNFSSNNYDTIKNPNLTYLSLKRNLVQVNGGFVHIDATAISPSDTVTLISENGDQLSQLISKREARINREACGKSLKVIISGAPTLFYQTENLKQLELAPEKDIAEIKTENAVKPGWAWWIVLIIVVVVCAIGLAGYLFIKNWRPNPNEVRFRGNSLTEFANNYGGLDKLHSLNPGNVPSKSEWSTLKSKDKIKKVKNLKGKKIIVKAENDIFSFHNGEHETESDLPVTYDPKETYIEPSDGEGNHDIHRLLVQMEKSILSEIKSSSLKVNDSLNEINRLSNENITLKTDKQRLDTLNSESLAKIEAIAIENKKVISELEQIKDKILVTDYLKGYAESVYSFLKLCDKVLADAYSLFNRISQQNLPKAPIISYLLIKFQSSTSTIPVGNWTQIVQDIKDTGATTNKQLMRSFAQIQNDDEKLREFQRIIMSEVLTKYSSSMLILAEAFRNIERFQVSSELVYDAQNIFGKHVSELVSKSKSTGFTIKYVPLFKNFEEYVGLIEAVDREKSLAYREVNNLGKGSIAEIVSYGIKTPFEETKTRIILV